jgi:23S rRNA (guanine745-N1)-methyltransferase
MLVCPVRDCRLPLVREDRQWRCERRHSFDIARSGYVNLLQPQDRRSPHPGDSAAGIAARRRLHDLGVTTPLLAAIQEMVCPSERDAVLDAGCGDGFYLANLGDQANLGNLTEEARFGAHGVDISVPAIEAAARRYPECQWIVANADRLVPYADRSFSVVMSITARMNASEFSRVLREDGRLLVAVPSPDDLIELRGTGQDRAARTIDTFARQFTLIDRRRVSTTAELDTAAVQDVLLAIYRPMRSRPVEATRVTFSLDLLLFRPSPCPDDSSAF